MSTTAHPRPTVRTADTHQRLRGIAVGSSALVALLYVLVYAGVLTVGRADAGELGILGFAGAVHALLAIALWRVESRVLWAGAAVLQVLLGWMYVAVAPERTPAYEVWGLTIRGLSAVLVVALVGLLLEARRR